ncbi:hypothetical protein FQA39_LY10348 [Lamprigera yunnana]|nr:hypothetical protein FQA39_LY10348 [Lamprigera yunnana]
MEGASQLNEAAPLVTTNTESNDAVRDDAISSTTSEKIFDRFSVAESCDAEADFLEAQLRISSVPGERITENVEDIVQDLENLLEESAHDFRFESRIESCSEVNSTNTSKENLEKDLDLQLSSHDVTSVSLNLSTDAPASETQLEDSSTKEDIFHTSDKKKIVEPYIESIIQNDDFVDSTQMIVENTSQHTHPLHAATTATVEEDSTPTSDNIENSNLIRDKIKPDQNQNEPLAQPKLTAQVSEENVNPDHDTKTELRQPLMVQVEESFNKVSGNEENIASTKPEHQNQNETVTENVHSILKIYNPADAIADTTCIPQKDCPSTSAPQPHPSSLSPLKITLQSLKNQSNAVYNSKITIKPIPRPEESILKSVLEDKLDISKAFSDHRKLFQSNLDYSPKSNKLKSEEQDKPVKLTIKPVLKQPEQERSSPKITFKPILKPTDPPPSEDKPAKITIKAIPKLDEIDSYQGGRNSPKITIKPLRKPEESHTKITIKPISYNEVEDQKQSPKITIKPVLKSQEDFESAIDNQRRVFIKSFRQNDGEIYTETHSPKITIKPVLKPEEYSDHKITIKSLLQSDIHYNEERHSPKITIKPIRHPDDLQITLEDPNAKLHIKRNDDDDKTPRITIKPVLKPTEECSVSSSRITLKPIHKSMDYQYSDDQAQGPFKLNIKPIQRSSDSSLSPKVTIKPVIKQEPLQMELIDFEDQIKQERIVLKIPKNRKNEMERVSKIKVKLSKEQGTAHILPTKRLSTDVLEHEPKYIKKEPFSDLPRGLVANVLPETLTMQNLKDVNIKKLNERPEDDIVDPLAEIPVYEITLESAIQKTIQPPGITIPPAPRKRGRPRKVPLVVREEFNDPKDERTVVDSFESARPKRSCRGPSVRTTLGIRGRKPRGGATRGRVGRPPGSKTKKV